MEGVDMSKVDSTSVCCLACVDESETGILERCGKYAGTVDHGLSFIPICFGVRLAGVVERRVCQLDFNCETKTKDNVFVFLKINILYQVMEERERDAFYRLDNARQQIRAFVYDEIRSAVPKITLDKVFEQKEDIAMSVKEELSKTMSDYGWRILQVLIADIEPDEGVKKAMNEINTAQRDRVATLDMAEADKLLAVKRAEAEAESKYLGGLGIARQRKAIAEGMRDSVLSFAGNVPDTTTADVMDLVLVTQYFDTLKELGDKARMATIFLPGTGGPAATVGEHIRTGMLEANSAMYAQAQVQGQGQRQPKRR